MAYVMYAGELQGRIETCHLAHRAREARHSVATMFYDNRNPLKYTAKMRDAWAKARKEGWRIVPVIVAPLSEWRSR